MVRGISEHAVPSRADPLRGKLSRREVRLEGNHRASRVDKCDGSTVQLLGESVGPG